jgi:hypothetical protein
MPMRPQTEGIPGTPRYRPNRTDSAQSYLSEREIKLDEQAKMRHLWASHVNLQPV